VPAACTLAADDQPLRVAEFDDLFASSLRAAQRPGPTRLRLVLDPAAEARARDLVARETVCCSFFTFTVTAANGGLVVDVDVPAPHVDLLDAIAQRAAAWSGR
jgi:hypothetical protein